MRKILITISLIILTLFFIMGCAATIRYTALGENRSPKPDDYLVHVYELSDDIDIEYEVIGKIHVGESGMTVNCDYGEMIAITIDQAHKVGADAIRLVEVQEPDFFSSCYRITALVLAYTETDSSL